jgi:hypothetical protein
MNMDSLRETLHQRIDVMPDFMVHRLASLMDMLGTKCANDAQNADWTEEEWRSFVMKELFRGDDEEDDPVVYTINDAQEVYNR